MYKNENILYLTNWLVQNKPLQEPAKNCTAKNFAIIMCRFNRQLQKVSMEQNMFMFNYVQKIMYKKKLECKFCVEY